MVIYKATNKINGKLYIGKTEVGLGLRMLKHRSNSKKPKTYFERALAKYGWDNFIFETIDFAQSAKELSEKEKYWIKYLNSTNKEIGYNCSPGGDGFQSEWFTPDIRKKMSERSSGEKNHYYGKKHSEEVRKRISEHHKEYYKDPAKRNRLGAKCTEEQVLRNKLSHLDKNGKKIRQIDIQTGETVKIWDCVATACRAISGRNDIQSRLISSVITGKKKTAYGYKWAYL